jgi:hypothetical protein
MYHHLGLAWNINALLLLILHKYIMSKFAFVVEWSEFLGTDPEVRVRFPTLPDFLRVVGLEQGPLSLVSTVEELLGRKK